MTNAAALLLIDVQVGFDDPVWGPRNNPQAEANVATLLAHWREREAPAIHVQHCSLEPGSPLTEGLPGWAFKPEAMPRPKEACFGKTVNSAFIGTGLEAYLKEQGISALVVAGLTTDHCVSTSVRMAGNLGFAVTLVSDATATFDRQGPGGETHSAEAIHTIHLASLDREFCQVTTTAEVLAKAL